MSHKKIDCFGRQARIGSGNGDNDVLALEEITSAAVNHGVQMYVITKDSGDVVWQVMPDIEGEFWNWHFDNNEQEHPSAIDACRHYVMAYQQWEKMQ